MSNFAISFQVQGTGEVTLPVTALDELILKVAGLAVSTFRFSVENTLAREVSLGVGAATSGSGASKVSISFDLPIVTIPAGASQVVTVTITPNAPLLEGDVIDVAISGIETF